MLTFAIKIAKYFTQIWVLMAVQASKGINDQPSNLAEFCLKSATIKP